MLIFLWGALSLGDGSEAPRELVGLPLTDLEMGDAYSELPGGRLLRVCSPATHRDKADPKLFSSQNHHVSYPTAPHTSFLSAFLPTPPPPATGSPRKEGLVGKERKGRAPKTSSVGEYNQQRSPEV